MRIIFNATFLMVLFFGFGEYSANAQDSLRQELETITVYALRSDLFSGSESRQIDSLLPAYYLHGSLSKVLQHNGQSEIKSYGAPGSLASISMRGAGSENTVINLNGFPLNSLSTGGTDLSLLPAAFFADIRIQPGAEAGLFGSGTFGGAIELNTLSKKPLYGTEFKLSSEIGSYGNQKYLGQVRIKNQTVHYKSSAVLQKAKNNFPFTNYHKMGQPEEIRTHNSYQYYGWMQTAAIQFSQRDRLEMSSVLFNKEMQLPEVASSFGTSHKMQNDSGAYFTLRYNKSFNNSRLSVGSAFLLNALQYNERNPEPEQADLLNSQIKAVRFINEVSMRHYLSEKISTESGFAIHYLKAESANYPEASQENNGHIFTAWRFEMPKTLVKLSARTELSEYYESLALFSAGIFRNIFDEKLQLSVSVANQFRRPTFNERFWQPGGNPNIQPEKALNGETGIKYEILKKIHHQLKIHTKAYYTKINNMIRWLPQDGVWTAQNNRIVHNRGFENNLNYAFQFGKIHSRFNMSYHYTVSDTMGMFNKNAPTAQQLMYVPKHKVNLQWNIRRNNFTLGIATRYSGKRYSTDKAVLNNELPAYFTADIFAGQKWSLKKMTLELQARIENVGNTQYESIRSYPLPGRMFFAGLSFYFTKSHKNAQP